MLYLPGIAQLHFAAINRILQQTWRLSEDMDTRSRLMMVSMCLAIIKVCYG